MLSRNGGVGKSTVYSFDADGTVESSTLNNVDDPMMGSMPGPSVSLKSGPRPRIPSCRLDGAAVAVAGELLSSPLRLQLRSILPG